MFRCANKHIYEAFFHLPLRKRWSLSIGTKLWPFRGFPRARKRLAISRYLACSRNETGKARSSCSFVVLLVCLRRRAINGSDERRVSAVSHLRVVCSIPQQTRFLESRYGTSVSFRFSVHPLVSENSHLFLTSKRDKTGGSGIRTHRNGFAFAATEPRGGTAPRGFAATERLVSLSKTSKND